MSGHRSLRATVAGLLSVVLVACTNGTTATPDTVPPSVADSSLAPSPTPSPAAVANWTMIVYLAADNDLEEASLFDATEMTAAAVAGLNVIVVHDRSPLGEVDGGPGFTSDALGTIGDWSGTRAYQVTPGGYVDLGISSDADMTDPAVYEALTAQVLQQFPSEHQALFFWSHGGAWQGAMMDDSSNPNSILSTDDLADAVGRALTTIGDDRVDLVVYDSCLMGELSAASAFSDVARYLLASEESVPSHSLDYADLTAAASSATPADFGSALLGGFMQHATDYGTVDTVTMSLVDLDGVAELDAALGELAQAAATLSGTDAIAMMRAVRSTLSFGGGQFFMADLGQYTQLAITGNAAVNAALARISAAVSAMVVHHDEGIAYEGATGLAAYLPPTINEYNPAYREVGGLSARWGQFLDALFNAGADAVSANTVGFSIAPQAAWNGDYLAVIAEVEPGVALGLVERTAYVGLSSPEGIIVTYATPVPEIDSGVTIGGQFSAGAFALATADGNFIHLITLSETSIESDREILTGVVPLNYTAPGGQQVQVWMLVSLRADAPDDAMPTLQLFAQQENGSLGAFTPDPAGTLDAWLGTYQADGTVVVRSNTELFATAPLPADLTQLFLLPVPIDTGATDFFSLPLVAGIRIVDGSGQSAIGWAELT